MNALTRYDTACRALAEARSVDEAKDVRDKAEAMRIYARQAKNRDLEIDAAEIRLRAERRLGEIIRAQKETVGLAPGGTPYRASTCSQTERVERPPPTLTELGIDRKLSMRAQQLAAVPAARFEEQIGTWRERVADENERVTVSLFEGGRARPGEGRARAALRAGRHRG